MAPGLSSLLDRWAFASAQVGLGSNALLAACLTELITDTPWEKKHLHEVLLPPRDCRDSLLSRASRRAAEIICSSLLLDGNLTLFLT